jgi:hypothetical protein
MGAPRGLTTEGRNLPKAIGAAGLILDVTHFGDKSFWEALNIYQSPINASQPPQVSCPGAGRPLACRRADSGNGDRNAVIAAGGYGRILTLPAMPEDRRGLSLSENAVAHGIRIQLIASNISGASGPDLNGQVQ